jgi:hypothetical protein
MRHNSTCHSQRSFRSVRKLHGCSAPEEFAPRRRGSAADHLWSSKLSQDPQGVCVGSLPDVHLSFITAVTTATIRPWVSGGFWLGFAEGFAPPTIPNVRCLTDPAERHESRWATHGAGCRTCAGPVPDLCRTCAGPVARAKQLAPGMGQRPRNDSRCTSHSRRRPSTYLPPERGIRCSAVSDVRRVRATATLRWR